MESYGLNLALPQSPFSSASLKNDQKFNCEGIGGDCVVLFPKELEPQVDLMFLAMGKGQPVSSLDTSCLTSSIATFLHLSLCLTPPSLSSTPSKSEILLGLRVL